MSDDRKRTARVLVAPDAFKGTIAAPAVATAIGRGLTTAGCAVDLCPVADGGEGTADALRSALGGRVEIRPTVDPFERPIDAAFTLLGDGTTAVVDTAAASGLALLAPDERDPWIATTAGTGQLIAAAIAAGATRILVAVGGSATVDGGRGAIEALAAAGGPRGVELVVLSDVRTPWERCAAVYGPQKGADPATVDRLARRLDDYAATLPGDPRGVPGTGGAGGLSGALWAVHGATIASGAAWVLDAVDFTARLRAADAVVCGEGRIDAQSLEGKIVGEIAARARSVDRPLHAIVGRSELDAGQAAALGLASVVEAGTEDALERAGSRLGAALVSRPRST